MRYLSLRARLRKRVIQLFQFKGRVKLMIALAKGKKLYDKRADIKAKDLKREAGREFKIKNM